MRRTPPAARLARRALLSAAVAALVVESPDTPAAMLGAARGDAAAVALAPRPIRPLLETSFAMRAGETVVVGTSKLDGPSNALVVLLSAIL